MGQPRSFLDEPADFSLVLGGPLYQLYLRTRLATPTLDLLRRRIIGISLIAWLPLLLLTAFAGRVVSGMAVPFLFDLDAHARFLGSLPLMITAEIIVHERIRFIVRQFLERDVIAPEDRLRFERIIASAMRVRNSVLAEVLLAVLVFTVGHWLWRGYITLEVATWYAAVTDGQTHLTPAGYWYAFVSLPIFRFVLVRWYFRLFIWYRFLWQVSRLPLRVNALHSDRAGGLGFLAGSVLALAPVLVAHTVLLTGLIANQICHQGATLPDFKLEIVAVMAFLMLLVLAPLTLFVGHLARAKRTATREYGIYRGQPLCRGLSAEVDRGHTGRGNSDGQRGYPIPGRPVEQLRRDARDASVPVREGYRRRASHHDRPAAAAPRVDDDLGGGNHRSARENGVVKLKPHAHSNRTHT